MGSVDAKLGTGWKFAISVTAVFTLAVATLHATNMIYADETHSGSVLWLTILIRSVLILLILGISSLLLVTSVIRNNRVSGRAKQLFTIPFSLLVLVLLLEFTLRFSGRFLASLAALGYVIPVDVEVPPAPETVQWPWPGDEKLLLGLT